MKNVQCCTKHSDEIGLITSQALTWFCLCGSFLDKMYVLSSEDAMGKFLKNPRPYLLPPLPRPPCKLVITGPPMSGKTTMAHQLAQKYGAKVSAYTPCDYVVLLTVDVVLSLQGQCIHTM